MEKIISEGKNFEEAFENLLNDNNINEKEIIYKKEEQKGKLFKSGNIVVTAYKKDDIYEFSKEYLKNLINNLGLEVNFEILTKDERAVIKMHSDDNAILIGKNGQTIKALETLLKTKILTEIGVSFMISLDVEDYKTKKDNRIERLAKSLARDVIKTKMPITMENMTSYERRLVHNALTDFKGVETHSEGEEPNRHIVIEPK